jgi:REP element-mobilizing transposase RayT
MPRKPRKEMIINKGVYHIVCRGNNQRRIFRSSRDYKKFLQILKEAKKKYPFYLYSYNLLPNHYHLEIETIEISISKIMHQVNNTYVKYFRKRYGGSGHLFEDRFYSSLVLKEPYFWELACYIDLNAVRAGLVKRPEDYQWSSYLIYCQKNYDDDLVDRDRFLMYGGKDLEISRLNYLKFIKERLKLKKLPPFPIDKKMI